MEAGRWPRLHWTTRLPLAEFRIDVATHHAHLSSNGSSQSNSIVDDELRSLLLSDREILYASFVCFMAKRRNFPSKISQYPDHTCFVTSLAPFVNVIFNALDG